MTQIDIDRPDWPERIVRLRRGIVKRSIDVIGALFGLIFFAPFLIIVALAIYVGGGGPVIYAHRRIGKGGVAFDCLKFRTMARDGDAVLAAYLAANPEARREWAAARKLVHDPRVSCLGHLLRRTSLDELPQLWNVLRGDMSLVGPRPIVEDERHHYGQHMLSYCSVRPGLTGAWQVSGRSDTTYPERVAMDVNYVRSRTNRRDLLIMGRTVGVLISGRGAR